MDAGSHVVEDGGSFVRRRVVDGAVAAAAQGEVGTCQAGRAGDAAADNDPDQAH